MGRSRGDRISLPIAHTPTLADDTTPSSISFASSIMLTGTPCEWQAMMIRSALRMWSIQFNNSFHRFSTRSPILPSPSSAIFSISQSSQPWLSAHLLIESAQWFANLIDVPVGWPIMGRR